MYTIAATVRGAGTADEIRSRGGIPAVMYGAKEQSTPIAINAKEFEKLFKTAGETSVITITGVGENKDTLVHEVQTNAITGQIVHVDFYALEKGKKVRLNIPLVFGAAPAEKAGLILVKALHEIEIEVAPHEIPHEITLDLSSLAALGDHLTASQISLPASAELITSPDEIVASVTEFEEVKETGPLVIPPASEVAAPEAAGEAKKEE